MAVVLQNYGRLREYHITFYDGDRQVLDSVTVTAKAYTIHEILVEQALCLLPSYVERDYRRYSVRPGAVLVSPAS